MPKLSFRPHHQAARDTMWVGKGTGPLAMLIAAILMLAGMLAYWLH